MKRIDAVLQENAQNQEAVFVFPSEVAASAWADRFLQISGAGAVAMERFKAWDTFKGDSVRAREQDKTSIPPALRKLFALNLLYENAALCRAGDPPVFRSLVNPQYAHSASSFAPWIASLLPPLALYVERRRTPAGDEDRDLFALAAHYREFLAENNLFEPAWEKPPLDTGGKQVFIFYPELLEDFIDYETLLASAPSVTIVRSPRADTRPECRVFPNSRAELRAAAMHIRRLVDEGLDWQEIALSVPDGDTYGPYLQRELELYGIPVVNHIGKTLAAYPAGAFFPDIQRCEAEEFSWTALCRLLLNRHLPWKDAGAIRQLIDFGRRSICVNHTAWTDAFAGPAGAVEQRAAGFYTQIREHLTALVRAKSFGGMQRAYFAFRERFFIPPADSETDLILSRCVSELTELVNLENAWPRVRCPSPFAFFCRHLREKIYGPAQPRAGVGLFPFRLAAAAPFGCHIVVGASQKGITVIFSRLYFLGERLRASLGMADRAGAADVIA
ncbi:MAG: PD-(D/E)XK nuclease family protein, partial [Spirochaetaceae bacterium]|nr:PD-(D/E)XK nuclease family protein [Spirochaetaceae bacterium]